LTADIASKWPKAVPALTDEQRRISDDFMQLWHEILPERYRLIETFNHGYSVRNAPPGFTRTLEVGAGLGEHLAYEQLSAEQRAEYYALELRQNMADAIRERHPDINTVVGDCQDTLPFEDGYFDRIVAVHVLEHLPNLPAAIAEMHRLCNPRGGTVSVVIPCEGGLAYGLARRISAQRVFERRYRGHSYGWFIAREHLNRPSEIVDELTTLFEVSNRSFFPLAIPWVQVNLCIGLTLRPRALG
jgi:SAM-dependent methyltransferase